ncbi:ATP-dependent Clp protease ATP-binding subunit ClpA [Pedobacter steynii]|uniref:ATP-dependent Clp protease ATP-binding subunit ClpA n=1 Tax=Pedobacter steynii TaxID=430522 RepID=A0A1G9ZLD1_9SPHI|nr:ATP-dependent Clp protease ATP-binding subunit [Pedobacter steynii]NQX40081.1 ATP-dependent Clp protease ATP-binding subunit [Pedobacter steynii]SDN21343.1 ATP-dependent Clp protease ATP-binding subunit ClpA [Pedobacter steynii]
MSLTNISESVKLAIRVAQSLAKEYHNPEFTAAHLLKGLMHKDVGLRQFLSSIGKDEEYISEWAEVRIEELDKAASAPDEVKGSREIAKVFEEADHIRIKLGLDLITPVCILTALCKPTIGFKPDELKSFPIKERELLDLYIKDEEIQQVVSPGGSGKEAKASGAASALHKYCIDRIALARDGKTDPIIGRDREARMIMEILCRRTKPNVIITGDAGVGKTALVDGFAQDIIADNVPELLKGVQLFELDLGSLIAGASYKGEIEDRLKNILKEIKQFDKAVLFIDEIHTLLDNKGPIGGGVGNLLKPELARGEITVIGATTIDEYRKIIEPEQAFSRRFEVLQVNEPNEASAIKMLEKLKEKYEDHHQLKIQPDSIPECVRLAKRYMKDRRLPDSAFDLLDRTMAAMKMMNDTSDKVLEELSVRLGELEISEEAEEIRLADYRWLYSQLMDKVSPVLLGQLTDETQVEAFEAIEEYHDYLSKNLAALKLLAEQKTDEVHKQDIASIVSYKTGIPLGKIQAQEKEKLLNMEQFLKRRVVGQDQALRAVSDAILESRSGLNKKGQPIGSFFLLGPTGTGKTELAKSIAEFLFNDEKAMIRFDMSEFKEEHSAALLYGAPPGYVGYEEGGLLVNKIRQQPYSVLLFDEIEKAHPSVFDTFLQILDEGHMHDRLGKEGDFSNSLILFTSNIGSEWIAEQVAKGEIPTSQQLMEIMARHFRPEFLARLSEIVPFAPISEHNVVRIFEIQLKSLIEALDKQGIAFEIEPEAVKMLALSGFTPKYGARQLSGVIRNELRRPISKYIISGELKKGNLIVIKKHENEERLEWEIIEQSAVTELENKI